MSGEIGPRHVSKSNLVSGQDFRCAAKRIRATRASAHGGFSSRFAFIRRLLKLFSLETKSSQAFPIAGNGRTANQKFPLRFAPLILLALGISCWGAPKIKDADCLTCHGDASLTTVRHEGTKEDS